ncbi:hypothetical protein RF55_2782 [Lasius niger]|uniref:Uncharacterized protein n=1 Tax=Lasius niger TaxID=67767 RepID=A0A0J7L2J7_LASNI|nr:hypothetical protein RF55_2782 [Lasius niger]
MAVLPRRNGKGSEKYLRLYIREQKEEVGKRSGIAKGREEKVNEDEEYNESGEDVRKRRKVQTQSKKK